MILLLNCNEKKMDSEKLTSPILEVELEKLTKEIWTLAQKSPNDCIFLVTLLRELELIHRKIRQELLETSLPDTRHTLYMLLKNIDEMGGWPYIERMRLQDICEKLLNNNDPSL